MTVSKYKIINSHHKDIDEHIEQMDAWDWSLFPLKSGEVGLRSSTIQNERITYQRCQYSILSKLRFRPKEKGIHFFIPDNESDKLIIMGKYDRRTKLFYIPNNRDFHAVTPPGFSGHFYSLSTEYFTKEFSGLDHSILIDPETDLPNPLLMSDEDSRILVHGFRLLHAISQDYPNSNKRLDDIFSTIFRSFINPIIKDTLRGNAGKKTTRKPLEYPHLICFLGLIHVNIENPPDINRLANECGISIRQVQKIFKQTLRISPTEYIKAVRLNEVRLKLLTQGAYRGAISSVANQYGFWHMGQFAKDFKLLFGYLPTQILEKESVDQAEEVE